MKELLIAAYLMVGLGASATMDPVEDLPGVAFCVRLAFWPITLGITITEHRAFIRDSHAILHEVAQIGEDGE